MGLVRRFEFALFPLKGLTYTTSSSYSVVFEAAAVDLAVSLFK